MERVLRCFDLSQIGEFVSATVDFAQYHHSQQQLECHRCLEASRETAVSGSAKIFPHCRHDTAGVDYLSVRPAFLRARHVGGFCKRVRRAIPGKSWIPLKGVIRFR
ncbi:hypothetical protein D3C85_1200510 [compost metagenome]